MGPFCPPRLADASPLLKFHLKWQRNEEHTLRRFAFYFSANILSSEITTMTPSFDMNGVARLESGVRTEN